MRMPVGKREIFITFRVGALHAHPLLGPCCCGKVRPRLLVERGGSFMGRALPSVFLRGTVATFVGLLNMLPSSFCAKCGENRVVLGCLQVGDKKHKNTENTSLCLIRIKLLVWTVSPKGTVLPTIYKGKPSFLR